MRGYNFTERARKVLAEDRVTLGSRTARLTVVLVVILGVTGACAARSRVSSFMTDACPLPPGPRYGVVVRAPASTLVDSVFLERVGRAIVHYWDPTGKEPSREKQRQEAAPAAVVAPPRYAVLWPPEWDPQPSDTAEVAFTMARGGGVTNVHLAGGDPEGRLGRSLLFAVREAKRWRDEKREGLDTLPPDLPTGAGDSLLLSLRFGAVGDAEPPDGTVLKFARQARPAVSVVGNTAPRYPERLRETGIQGDVLMQFQITPAGTMREGSLRVLRSSHGAFTQAVLDVLPNYRFTAPMLDCEPVFQLVQLPFAFRLGRRPLLAPGAPPP